MTTTNRYELTLPDGTTYTRNDKRVYTHAVVSVHKNYGVGDTYSVNFCTNHLDAEKVAQANLSPWYLWTKAQKQLAQKAGRKPTPYYYHSYVVAL